ncbi:MAG: hypothetical protein AAF193_00880, partial [Bacteroidota bacterium]
YVPYGYHRDAIVDGTLNVYQTSDLFGDLTVNANSSLLGDLLVDGNSVFNGDVEVMSNTTLNGELDVLFGFPTYLSGDLTVDGTATFNGPVEFSEITVEESTTLNGVFLVNATSDFENTVNINSTLDVSGVTNLAGELNVGWDLDVVGQSDFHSRVLIDADINGPETETTSYPLQVEGSNQGILITLDGSETESNNFLSFVASGDQIVGRVEGQSLDELQSSFRFIWDVVMGGLEQAFVAAEGIACGSQLDLAESGVMLANNVVLGAQWVELTAYYELNAGVNFGSGGADYAEFLPLLNPSDKIYPGEVVGVKNGHVSRNTQNADHIMVVSTHPIVVGNLPPAGKESEYVRVAFIGQAPTQVIGGAKAGDYILPSGENDGLAIAVPADKLPTSQYKEIIGITWESSNSTGIRAINVAVGLNTNDLATRMAELEDRVARLESVLLGETMVELAEAPTATSVSSAFSGMEQKEILTDEEFEAWLESAAPIFESYMSDTKHMLEEKGSDYQQYEEIVFLLNQPTDALIAMREGVFLTSLWNHFDHRIKAQMKE